MDFHLCLLFHFKKGGDVMILYWAACVIGACNALYMWANVRIQYGRLKRVVSWVYNPPPIEDWSGVQTLQLQVDLVTGMHSY